MAEDDEVKDEDVDAKTEDVVAKTEDVVANNDKDTIAAFKPDKPEYFISSSLSSFYNLV